MSKWEQTHQACPCGKSSDAYSIDKEGNGHCFSCNKHFKGEIQQSMENEKGFSYEYLPWRSVSKETMEFFGAKTKCNEEGEPLVVGYPYPSGGYKVRNLKEKKFFSTGEMSVPQLFGMDKFSSGESKSVTITEGELDAMSVYQMLGSSYPVVSVRSASSAVADCGGGSAPNKELWEWINGFDQIYLCFDNDEPGRNAASAVAALFDFNKVYQVKTTRFKDANEYLVNGETKEFKNLWYNARRFIPEGIASKFSELDTILDESQDKPSVSYPFPTLQGMTYGIRTGERILFTALEGIGKTEIIRAIEAHLLKTTDAKIAILHLEENKSRSLKGLAGYELRTPTHLPDSMVTNDEVKMALRKLASTDERIHLYSHFGSTDPNTILDTVRFLVSVCGCKYVFLDHITMVVSGLTGDDERRTLDYLSTRFAMMTEELDFALIFISHENDDGKTRGSRNISKIADLWVQLVRNPEAATEKERNTTSLVIKKNRFASMTGPAGRLYFDKATFMINEVDPVDESLPPAELKESTA